MISIIVLCISSVYYGLQRAMYFTPQGAPELKLLRGPEILSGGLLIGFCIAGQNPTQQVLLCL